MELQDFLDNIITVKKGDYVYTRTGDSGWNVQVVDKNKTAYGPIENEVDGVPVMEMSCTFYGCKSLTDLGNFVIPNTVQKMYSTFMNCSNLTTAPTIPSSVNDMSRAFYGCSSLISKPEIPTSVKDKDNIFDNCNKSQSIANQVLSNDEQLSVPNGTDENDSHDEH